MISETYMERKTRDTRVRELKAQGIRVRLTTSSNQLLHPMYVNDYSKELTEEDRSFGNTLYKTHFPKLYNIDEF